MDYSKLTNTEIDRQIAEKVMGWKIIDQTNQGVSDGNYIYVIRSDKDKTLCKWEQVSMPEQWHPFTNIAQAMEVEDKIAELGLKDKYKAILTSMHYGDTWWAIHATPKERCEAALKAVTECAQSPSGKHVPEFSGNQGLSETGYWDTITEMNVCHYCGKELT